MEYLSPVRFLELMQTLPVLDVRSPGEYQKGHMPGAINLPLFEDGERAVIGILYKQKGKEEAIEKGLGIVGPKVLELTQKAKSYAREGKLLLHCWRGGMRSEKTALLLEMTGVECGVLEGGYKAFREQLHADLKEIPNLIILQGATGSGKTDILLEMAKRGEQVVDLEGLASHRGSTFGAIGMKEQPTTQQFQNDLHHALLETDPSRRVWMEGESATVGNCALPENLWASMNKARSVALEVPLEIRVDRLVQDYGGASAEEIEAGILRLHKRLGPNQMKEALEALAENDPHLVARLLLRHYDKSYRHGFAKHKTHSPVFIQCETGDPGQNAQKIIEEANRHKL